MVVKVVTVFTVVTVVTEVTAVTVVKEVTEVTVLCPHFQFVNNLYENNNIYISFVIAYG